MLRSLARQLRWLASRVTLGRRRAALDARLREELDFHAEMSAEARRGNMSADDARRTALALLGGREQWREAVRDQTRSRALDDLVRDTRFALRTLVAAPGFTLAATLTLALGIGANTVIFSVVDGVVLKPLPFPEPDRIVRLYQADRKKGRERDDVAPGNFAEWLVRSRAFSAMAVAEPYGVTYRGEQGVEELRTFDVTRGFFDILNERPLLGRVFDADDYVRRGQPVVVMTYASWRSRFGADSAIVGRRILLGDVPTTVIGVLPRDFTYLGTRTPQELYLPKVLDSIELNLRGPGWYNAVARLAPGVTLEQANADLNRVAAQLAVEYPNTNGDIGATVVRVRDGVVGDSSRALVLLLGAVGFVLLIACTNVANLMLARTARRSREFAIRMALGAGRGRIVRQVVTESFLLALAGGTGGVVLAYFGMGPVRAAIPAAVPRVDDMRVDGRALTFTVAVVVAATLIFGFAPAFRAADPASSEEIKAGGRAGSTTRHRRLRRTFVIAEIGLAVSLLVGAGLLVRSFESVVSADRGYRSDHVLGATMFIWETSPTPAARRQFVGELIRRARALPGVIAAGATSSPPLAAAVGMETGPFSVVGQVVPPGHDRMAHLTALTPSAFDVLGMRARRGRVFLPSDDSSTTPVVVVNESMATRYWPGENPIGQRIRVGYYTNPIEREIVGVVPDTKQLALDAPPLPTIYLPHEQAPTGSLWLVLRTSADPFALSRDVKRLVAELNPSLPVADIQSFDEIVADSLRPRRFVMVLLGAFAAAALALAMIGVYGVMSQGTAERNRELGVRIALGAQTGDIMRLVMLEGLASAAIGTALGLVGAAALSRSLATMLFETTPLDPMTFVFVAGTMIVTAAAACYAPARKATRVDPLVALRAG